jgi:uncharacterized protein YqhQ
MNNKIDFAVGGQAVIEGVMMRSPNFITIAVRKSKGHLKLKEDPFRAISMKVKLFSLPLIRGVVNMFEMLIIGTKIINYSANEMMDEEDDADKKFTAFQQIYTSIAFALSIVLALALSLFLFKFLPLWITDFLSKQIPAINQNWLLFNLIDGIIKTVFFVLYIGLIGLAPSLKRLFEYHGAEHKSIFTYENGKELTVENARSQSRFHPRCGTSFILVVFLISIFVYFFVPKQPDFIANFALRLAFLPLIAGISYEFLKWSARHQGKKWVDMLTAPGLMFQRLTTREPDDKQLEVALAALKKALELEKELVQNKTAVLDVK